MISSSGISSYILALEVTNLHSELSFHLRQVAFLVLISLLIFFYFFFLFDSYFVNFKLLISTTDWATSPLSYQEGPSFNRSNVNMFTVLPRQSTTLFFRLSPTDVMSRKASRRKQSILQDSDESSEVTVGVEEEAENKLLTYLSFVCIFRWCCLSYPLTTFS
jgi:hypothetical protein